MKQRFEVRQYTLCDGWVNNWTISDEKGNMIPHTFATIAEAEKELYEFLCDIEQEILSGERSEDEGYSRDEFVILAVE